MAQVEGWLMVRRPGCIPFVVFWADWESMPTSPVKHAAAAEDASSDGVDK